MSDETARRVARAAGQDAGAAGLALHSWALWALGYADQALAQMAAALDRAEAIEHPHTQAYVSYYASVLHALCGEAAPARLLVERCLHYRSDTPSDNGRVHLASYGTFVEVYSTRSLTRSRTCSGNWQNIVAPDRKWASLCCASLSAKRW
jgi:hypothetical protein